MLKTHLRLYHSSFFSLSLCAWHLVFHRQLFECKKANKRHSNIFLTGTEKEARSTLKMKKQKIPTGMNHSKNRPIHTYTSSYPVHIRGVEKMNRSWKKIISKETEATTTATPTKKEIIIQHSEKWVFNFFWTLYTYSYSRNMGIG